MLRKKIKESRTTQCLCEDILDLVSNMDIKEFNRLYLKMKELLSERKKRHKHIFEMRCLRNIFKDKIKLLADEGVLVDAGIKLGRDGEKVVLTVLENSSQILHIIWPEKVNESTRLIEKKKIAKKKILRYNQVLS